MDVAGLGKALENAGSFPSFRPPSGEAYHSQEGIRGRTLSKSCLRCVVCGDSSSGKHYGVLACNGCSGFFKRSVRRKLIYRCQAASGDCIVDKAHRNQCQACRLKKCLECGMNKAAVQNERQPRNSATVRPEFAFSTAATKPYVKGPPAVDPTLVSDITVGVFSPFFTLPTKMYPPNPFLLPRYHHQLKEEDMTPELTSPRKVCQEDEEIANATQQFRSSPAAAAKSETGFDPTKESVQETSSRILLMTIRWARNFPSFSSLCFDDQLALLEETWSELFLLSALQWGLPLDMNPLFSALQTILPKTSGTILKHIYVLQKAASRLKLLGTDLAEFACLKAIVLFKPDAGRIKDSYQVEMLQDHAQLMLAHHIKTQHIDYTFRFGHLLLMLPTLRQIPAETVEAFFFGNIIGSTSMETLLRDMFKS